MKRFKVFKEVIHTFIAEVEAETEEEANNLAEKLDNEEWDLLGMDPVRTEIKNEFTMEEE